MNSVREKKILKDLGAGLILRRSVPDDAEALADFNSRIHSDNGPDKPDERIAAWTRDLLTRPHPTFTPDDFTIVEEAATGRIVSSLNLIPQTWTYEGIPFGVGRPELVGTLPEFRNRGLIREQFDEVHKWSAESNQMVQAITGIPYFYRKFGYEMAMNLGGRRIGYEPHVPKLKESESEPYCMRPATCVDLPFVAELYGQTQTRYPIVCSRTPESWQYEFEGQSQNSLAHYELRIIESASGEGVGYLMYHVELHAGGLLATGYELKPGISWLAVTPSVVRYLWETGRSLAERDGTQHTSFGFDLGAEHPVYETLEHQIPSKRRPYAWYLRVPDLAGFLRHIAPALEKRLADSIAAGHSGTLKISFFQPKGLQIVIEHGRLTGIEMTKLDDDNVDLPGLTFLQMVFGHRNLDELYLSFPDCLWDTNETRVLLNILFPKKPSCVFGIV
jgi:hypothetical protein